MKEVLTFVFICWSIVTNGQRIIPLRTLNESEPFDAFDGLVKCAVSWNDRIIVVGSFNQYGDLICDNIVSWNDGVYENFQGPTADISYINEAFVYENDLIVSCKQPDGLQHLYRLFEEEWIELGNGISLSYADQTVFNGEIFISSLENEPLRKWNNSAWIPVENSGFSAISDLHVFNNLLYVCGTDLNNIPRVASWDGIVWQIVEGINTLSAMQFADNNGILYLCGAFTNGTWSGGLAVVNDGVLFPSDLISNHVCESIFFHEDNLFSVFEGNDLKKVFSCNDFKCGSGTSVSISPDWRPIHFFEHQNDAILVIDYAHTYNEMNGAEMKGIFKFAHGRDIQFLDDQQLIAFREPQPMLFYSDRFEDQSLVYHSSSDQKISSIFLPWVGARHEADTLVAAGRFLNNAGFSWAFGPVADNMNVAYAEKYYRVWKVSRQEVEYHMDHYGDSNYVIPEDILSWPGNGNTSNGEALQLAPYHDMNGDLIYDPASGDYPIIHGDRCLLTISSSDRMANGVSVFPSMSVDLIQYLYTYESSNATLNSTVFAHFEVINRSVHNYSDLTFGLHQMWNPSWEERFIGCDSTRSLAYSYYDQTPVDFGTGDSQLNDHPFAFGSKMLYPDARVHRAYYNTSIWSIGEPTSVADYYHYMMGEDKNGSVDPLSGLFVYSDSPCSTGLDVDELASSDDNTILATSTEGLSMGAFQCFDFAFFVHHDLNMDHLGNACGIGTSTDILQNFYLNEPSFCYDFPLSRDGIVMRETTLYPNPCDDYLLCEFGIPTGARFQYAIYNMFGQLVEEDKNRISDSSHVILDTHGLPIGSYVLQVTHDGSTFSSLFLKR